MPRAVIVLDSIEKFGYVGTTDAGEFALPPLRRGSSGTACAQRDRRHGAATPSVVCGSRTGTFPDTPALAGGTSVFAPSQGWNFPKVPLRLKNMSDRASLTILVVDDDEKMLTGVAEILRRSGYRVLTARDGPEAMTALHENPGIALLFTDIKMPTIDGFMLADMAKVRRPDLKVLYGTGFADYVSTQQGVRYGKILDKPYDPEQLREEVRLLLGA